MSNDNVLFQKINHVSPVESWSRAGKNELTICTECSAATRMRSSRRNWRNEEPMEQNCLRCTTDEGGDGSRGRVRSPTSLRHNKIARRKKRPRGRDCPERSPNQAPTSSLFLSLALFSIFFPSRNPGHLLSLAAPRSRSRRTEQKFDPSDDVVIDSNFHAGVSRLF